MEVVRSRPLHEQIYDAMVSLILKGEFPPGERLVETKLAQQLGVARGTVREAVRMLLKDGLLTQSQGVIFVYKPSARDVIEVYQCRERLESLAASLAAASMTEALENELSTIIEKSKKAFLDERLEEMILLNTQFHDLIIKSSQNNQLIKLLETIRLKSLYMRSNILRDYYNSAKDSRYIEDHENIFTALKEKNPIKAQEEMSRHIQHDLEMFQKLFISAKDEEINYL